MSHCTGKVRHKTREGACIVKRRMKNAGLAVYQCRLCDGWHVGNHPKKKLARMNQLFARIKRARELAQSV